MISKSVVAQLVSSTNAEQVIATGRLLLAGVFLAAVWIDPSEPSQYAEATLAALEVYLVYAALLAAVIWNRGAGSRRRQLVMHGSDLVFLLCVTWLTKGPNTPFYSYFIFILVSATLRWQWRGTLCTAGAAVAAMLVTAWYPHNVLLDRDFEANRFIIRVFNLGIMAAILSYLGAFEESRRRTLSMLAQWPSPPTGTADTDLRATLGHAAGVLRVPRLLLVWEEEEEPWLNLVLWSAQGCQQHREPPGSYGAVVLGQPEGETFSCTGSNGSDATVPCHTGTGLGRPGEAQLDPELRRRFSIDTFAAARIQGENCAGFLLVLDRARMTGEDLVLAEVVGQQVVARIDHALLQERLREAAAAEERVRLARDLHDGLLQSLAAADLHLETAQQLMGGDRQPASGLVAEAQLLLRSEQEDLRGHINEMKGVLVERPTPEFDLVQRLGDLAERIRRQWAIACIVNCQPASPRLAPPMAREVYFVLHEALFNAARHAGARSLHADLRFRAGQVCITVADDGAGFPFRGAYDQDQLSEMKRGPVVLRERINALSGSLLVHSSESGARLDITLPLTGV